MIEFSARAKNFSRQPISEFSNDLPPGTINLSSGSPALGLMPINEFQEAAARVLHSKQFRSFQYGPAQGCPELLDWIADYHSVDRSQVMITSGSQQSIDLIIRIFVDDGDSVLVESPSYSGALDAFSWASANLVGMTSVATIPDGEFKLVYVEPSYQNPTGRCWTHQQRRSFMTEAQRKNMLVIEDAAYAEISFGNRNLSLREIEPARVIYLGSFSKVLSPGIRLSYVIAETRIISKLVEAKKITDMATSYFLQSVTENMLLSFSFDYHQHLVDLRRAYRKRRDWLIHALAKHCPAAKFNIPDGGIFLWVNTALPSDELRWRALANGISVVPGSEFYVQDPDPCAVRLSYSRITEKDAELAAQALAKVLK